MEGIWKLKKEQSNKVAGMAYIKVSSTLIKIDLSASGVQVALQERMRVISNEQITFMFQNV